jgi:hypothetical protein
MTKKDYQAIARAIHMAKPAPLENAAKTDAGLPPDEAYDAKEYDTWSRVAYSIADHALYANPRFDRARFIEACETGRCKGMKA